MNPWLPILLTCSAPEWLPPPPPCQEVREGEIELLPLLWPRPTEGRAQYQSRRGFTVFLEWKEGKPSSVQISGPEDERIRLRFRDQSLDILIGPEGHLGFSAEDFRE